MLSLSTLYDLDILCPPHQQKASLWDKLNYCQTAGGQQELKKILLLEEHSLEKTLARQQAIAYILAKAKEIVFPVKENEVFYLQHYMNSNYTIDHTTTKIMLAVKSYTKLIIAKGDYLYILSAVKQALFIIDQVKSAYEQLHSSTAPALLRDIFDTIETCLGKLQIKDAINIQQHEPNPMMLYQADRQIRLEDRDAVDTLLAAYYQLEALSSLAKAHRDMQLVFPEIGGRLTITGMRHPMVKHCHANNVALNDEHTILVTGPNMAGKSTFLKSLGLTFIMAYTGIGVAAEYARVPFLKQIITSILTEDDIGKGYSYFYTEVLRVKAIATALRQQPSTLIIADELFKGTNVKDANDCTETVVNGCLKQSNGLFIIATHLVETVQKFTGNNHCRLLCFEGTIASGTIEFDYVLKEGVSVTRLGTHIMEQEDIPALFGL